MSARATPFGEAGAARGHQIRKIRILAARRRYTRPTGDRRVVGALGADDRIEQTGLVDPEMRQISLELQVWLPVSSKVQEVDAELEELEGPLLVHRSMNMSTTERPRLHAVSIAIHCAHGLESPDAGELVADGFGREGVGGGHVDRLGRGRLTLV